MTSERPWLRFYGSVPDGIDDPRITLYEAVVAAIDRCATTPIAATGCTAATPAGATPTASCALRCGASA
jgi:hypothetical protein